MVEALIKESRETSHMTDNSVKVFKFLCFQFFLQIASPACTELEVIMLDWLGKMLDLPEEFLACSGGKGGGVIQVRETLFSPPPPLVVVLIFNFQKLINKNEVVKKY